MSKLYKLSNNLILSKELIEKINFIIEDDLPLYHINFCGLKLFRKKGDLIFVFVDGSKLVGKGDIYKICNKLLKIRKESLKINNLSKLDIQLIK